MSIHRPALGLTVDGRALSGPEASVSGALVELRDGDALDRVVALVGPLSPLLDASAAAEIEVTLADGDDVTTLLHGVVTAVSHQPSGTTIEGLTDAVALARTRVGRSYVQQSVGDIVTDLCSTASVDPGDLDGDVTLSAFHADERRTAWQHVCHLAELTGRAVTSGADGSLNFTKPRTGAADHTLRGGAELLAWAAGARQPVPVPPPSKPLAAAAEQGADAWHLLLHEPDGGSVALLDSAIRDQSSADAWGDGLAATATRRGTGGWIAITGDPTVRVGDLVEVTDVDRAAGTYRVRAVDHRIDGHGFTSRLRLEGVA